MWEHISSTLKHLSPSVPVVWGPHASSADACPSRAQLWTPVYVGGWERRWCSRFDAWLHLGTLTLEIHWNYVITILWPFDVLNSWFASLRPNASGLLPCASCGSLWPMQSCTPSHSSHTCAGPCFFGTCVSHARWTCPGLDAEGILGAGGLRCPLDAWIDTAKESQERPSSQTGVK